MNRNFETMDKILNELKENVNNLNCKEAKTLSITYVTLQKQLHYDQIKNEHFDYFKNNKETFVKIKDKIHDNIDNSAEIGDYKDSYEWTNTLNNINKTISTFEQFTKYIKCNLRTLTRNIVREQK